MTNPQHTQVGVEELKKYLDEEIKNQFLWEPNNKHEESIKWGMINAYQNVRINFVGTSLNVDKVEPGEDVLRGKENYKDITWKRINDNLTIG